MTATIELDDSCPDRWTPDHKFCHRIMTAACRVAGLHYDVTISLRFVDAEESLALNNMYRKKSTATNVLSFPAAWPPLVVDTPRSEPLGDIVVCPVVVEAEAKQQMKTLEDHWSHMLVHGFYHLVGYNHITESDSASMEALEVECLKKLGISNPYLIG